MYWRLMAGLTSLHDSCILPALSSTSQCRIHLSRSYYLASYS